MSEETLYAFPHKFNSSQNETIVCFGMELRDYFAAKAMQGLLSSDVYAPKDQFAQNAYAMADEMLKAREQ